MKTVKNIFTIIVCIIISTNIFSQTEIRNGVVIDHGAQKIVKNVIAQIKKDTPFSFNFTYNIKDKEIGNKKGSGKFLSYNAKYCITSNDFCHWSNGVTMWNLIKNKNEVEIMDAEDENTMFNFVKIINRSVNNYRPKLIRQEIFNKTNCNVIDLTPKKASSISKIRIFSSVNNNRIQKMEISTYIGSNYNFTFTSYNTNKTVNDNNFIFPQKSYPKVKQIDLR